MHISVFTSLHLKIRENYFLKDMNFFIFYYFLYKSIILSFVIFTIDYFVYSTQFSYIYIHLCKCFFVIHRVRFLYIPTSQHTTLACIFCNIPTSQRPICIDIHVNDDGASVCSNVPSTQWNDSILRCIFRRYTNVPSVLIICIIAGISDGTLG